MDFANLLRRARSIRRFREGEAVTRDDLLTLVDLARLSPSGGNAQPLRYWLVAGVEASAMFPYTAWAALLPSWGGPKPSERPAGYVLILTAAGKPNEKIPPHGSYRPYASSAKQQRTTSHRTAKPFQPENLPIPTTENRMRSRSSSILQCSNQIRRRNPFALTVQFQSFAI